jgi:hypothetical protein
MWTSRTIQTALGIATLTVIAAAIGHAQSPPAPSQDPVVLEIRALRADLNERLEATMRTQLLVARLQVQEQRTNTVVRQLQELDAKLKENDASKEQVEQGMKMFGGMLKPGENDEGAEFFLGPLKAGMEKVAKVDAELRMQQTQLTGTLAEEQARWVALNSKLDELEKMFATPKKPAR